ncbi:hypothetical protein G7K_0405-t1 [Saitoella complicata NRRL Y-17804]|uniref:Uncharacterized protein n=1 Tax=Saitoella complicata (strain BCRC 22490 / CBS 7301 / JCM 7358 / NBRC 10748 / NRRL Y-17804) TaxID=698492 RepID=A0A0E9N8P3_SAICN|nr:hypothetical protein G7K_0405-t1 [Saitoella complicata NRRL Y-17804]
MHMNGRSRLSRKVYKDPGAAVTHLPVLQAAGHGLVVNASSSQNSGRNPTSMSPAARRMHVSVLLTVTNEYRMKATSSDEDTLQSLPSPEIMLNLENSYDFWRCRELTSSPQPPSQVCHRRQTRGNTLSWWSRTLFTRELGPSSLRVINRGNARVGLSSEPRVHVDLKTLCGLLAVNSLMPYPHQLTME